MIPSPITTTNMMNVLIKAMIQFLLLKRAAQKMISRMPAKLTSNSTHKRFRLEGELASILPAVMSINHMNGMVACSIPNPKNHVACR